MGNTIAIVTPALRHDELLDAMLASLAAEQLPADTTLDVVVAVKEPSTRPTPLGLSVRFVANPTGSIPAGLNAAIAASKGAVVVRVDSRCDLPTNYVATLADWLARDNVGCAGGGQLVTDPGLIGQTYAVAFNSPLLGPSAYRYSRTSGPTDSPYLGSWRRAVLEQLGGFDERLLRNQDNELAARVHAAGFEAIYDASLVVGYRASRNLRGLIAHHREFGRWRARQRGMGQQSVSRRQLLVLLGVAVAAVGGLALLALPATRTFALVSGLIGYLALAGIGGFCAGRMRRTRPDLGLRRLNPGAIALAPAVAGILNLAWLTSYVAARQERMPSTA